MMVQTGPTVTRESYDRVVERLTGGKSRFETTADWPVPGVLSHQAGEGPDGFVVVDVWESEEAFARFGAVIGPILNELGIDGPPAVFAAYAHVTREKP